MSASLTPEELNRIDARTGCESCLRETDTSRTGQILLHGTDPIASIFIVDPGHRILATQVGPADTAVPTMIDGDFPQSHDFRSRT